LILPTAPSYPKRWKRSSNRPDQKIEHRVLLRAVVLPESEFVQIEVHVLRRHMNVCAGDGLLEQPPEAFDVVRVMQDAGLPVIPRPLFDAVVDLTVLEPVAL